MPPPGQLSNTILHHPGTFDSCLEVDIADDYQDHQMIRSIRIIRMMIPWHLGNFNSDQIFKSNQCQVSPTLRALRTRTRFPQVSSPTLKGKHCLLTSFVKGAGIMQGVFFIDQVAFGHPQTYHLGVHFFSPSWQSQSSQKVPEVPMTMLETRCDVDCTILSTPSFPSIGTCTRRER